MWISQPSVLNQGHKMFRAGAPLGGAGTRLDLDQPKDDIAVALAGLRRDIRFLALSNRSLPRT